MTETNDRNTITVLRDDLQLVLECAVRAVEVAKLCIFFQREESARSINIGPTYSEKALQETEQRIQQESEAIERLKQLLRKS